jgi:AraC-like DNA-binding protein
MNDTTAQVKHSSTTLPNAAWLDNVADLPDHYHGFSWSPGVMPNNFLFFVRQDAAEMKPESVSHCLHHRYEMVIPYEGIGQVYVEGKIYTLEPGSALLLSPGTFHRYFDLPAEGFRWLFFTFELDANLGKKLATGAPYIIDNDDYERIAKSGELYTSYKVNDSLIFEVGLQMGRIIQSLQKKSAVSAIEDPDDKAQGTCELLNSITTYVHQNMEQAVRIGDLAKHVGISESNLRKTFRDSFGCSLGSYLQRSRLTRSVEIINRKDISISKIARLCGFESIFSFSQSFKKAIGMSPTAYRKHLTQKKPPIKMALQNDLNR